METRASIREKNNLLLSYLETPGLEKKAADSLNAFTRVQMREDSFSRKILELVEISNDELDRAVDTDLPQKIIDKEPGGPPAFSTSFGTLPINFYIKAPRYRVLFDRVLTHRFTKDVDELRTYDMDVRQVMSDNAIKDMLAEEDGKFLTSVNSALGSKDTNHPIAGVPLYVGISGGMTRENVVESLKTMNKTPYRLESHTALTNFVTIKEFMKWGRDEMGGDFSQDVVKNGWSEVNFLGQRWIVTIKRDLVVDDTVYYFADPKFIGKSFVLENTTMYIKREAFMLEWFAYETIGQAIGHMGGLSRVDFE